MMFYFMMCSWLDGDDPQVYTQGYTHHVFVLLWERNQIYRDSYYIASCLDY